MNITGLQVGEWNEKAQLEMFKNETPVWSSGSTKKPVDVPNILKGKTLIIATILVRIMEENAVSRKFALINAFV